ncbi:MAG: aromatic ring-hydroxylating dioxygenase subunit alpha [Truepera sp.]|nr:aromatic ring-hydroxylating dioxygenase subunit alpha [Truepera sp.]
MTQRKQGLLPVEAYTSQAWFDWEQEELFGRTWNFAGMASDLKGPGDYLTVQAGVHPIFVVRGQDHRLRAFHNICRHRGTQLLRAAGRSRKQIVCPYHNWTYSLNGRLESISDEATQYSHIEISKDDFCLHGASVETWQEMVFVHPEPDPGPFMDWLAEVPKYIGPHRPERLREYGWSRVQYAVNANWKILMENFIDGYHLSHLHHKTLDMYDHERQEWRFSGDHWVFYEPLTKAFRENLRSWSPLPIIDHLPEDRIGAYLQILFPTVGVTQTEGFWSTFQFLPVAADKTLLDIRTRTMPLPAASTALYEAYGAVKGLFQGGNRRKTVADLIGTFTASTWSASSQALGGDGEEQDPLASGDFMLEDIYACEQQQRAMRSPKFSAAPMSKDESSVLELHRSIVSYLPLEAWEDRR